MIYGLDEYNQLKFLEQYNFNVENHSNGRYTEIYLINDDGCIVYHEWPQFGNCAVFVSKSSEDYQNHKFLRSYNLNWFVNNIKPDLKNKNLKKRYSFIELVKFYIEEELKNNNAIFEVKVKCARDLH